jgi:hypothetical protein
MAARAVLLDLSTAIVSGVAGTEAAAGREEKENEVTGTIRPTRELRNEVEHERL